MSNEQLMEAALAMPLPDRVSLAQELWRSITETAPIPGPEEDHQEIAEAKRRDSELSSGTARPRTHEEVMAEARRSINCG
jgi:hypothetical protein